MSVETITPERTPALSFPEETIRSGQGGMPLGDMLRALGVGDLGALGGRGFGTQRDPYQDRVVRSPMKQESWVWAALELHGWSVIQAMLRAFDGDPEDGNELKDSPILDLLRRPNPVTATDGLLRACDIQSETLDGESFWALTDIEGNPVASTSPDADGLIDLPARIWPVSGKMVEPVVDRARGMIVGWRFPTPTGSRKVFPSAAVVQHIHMPDPDRYGRGAGPLSALMGPVTSSWMAKRYTSRLLEKDGRVAGVVVVGGTMEGTQQRQLESRMDETWSNNDDPGRWRVLAGKDMTLHFGAQTAREMEWRGLVETTREDMGAALQTPSALLGHNVVNYATFAGHLRRYIGLRLAPWLNRRAQTINRMLERLRDSRLSRHRVAYTIEPLLKLIGDLEQQSRFLAQATKAGVPLDTAAKSAGLVLDPIDGGDVSMVNLATIPLTSAQERGRALAVQAQAGAATALQNAGVDGQAALEAAGLGELKFVEPPEEPQTPPPPAKPSGGGGNAPAPAGKPAAAAPAPTGNGAKFHVEPEERALSPKQKRAARRRVEAVSAGPRRKMVSGLRRQIFMQRNRQLEVYNRIAGGGKALAVPALYPEPPPTRVPEKVWGALRIAMDRDRSRDDSAHAEAWLRRHKALKRWDLSRLRDLAGLSVLRYTEAQIDEMIIVLEQKWIDAMASVVETQSLAAYGDAATAMANQFGGVVIDLADPDVLKAFADKSIKVIEGTQSVLAKRLRTRIIDVFNSGGVPSTASLRVAVEKTLTELRATTTQAFRSHSQRARTIAQTEVGGAVSIARDRESVSLADDGLIEKHVWLTSGRAAAPEGTVRPSHHSMEGQEVKVGDEFTSGAGNKARHPFGFGIAAEDIECHCLAEPIPID